MPKRSPRSQAAPKVALLDRPRRRLRRGESEDSVHAAIYEAVMDHRLPPGVKLTEEAFAEFFGVSRTIIRKALFRLSQQSVVELRPNRGAVVASPTPAETHDVFQARRLIERELIRRVSQSRTKKQLDELKALVRLEKSAQLARDARALVRLTGEFHVRLAQFAQSPVLANVVASLVSRTSLIIALYEAPGVAACPAHDHSELISLIEAGDGAAAAQAMSQHLAEIEDHLDLTTTHGPLDLNKVFDGA